MTQAPFLEGEHIYLRALVPKDAQGPYPTWFNDPEVCEGNGHHYYPYTPQDAAEFIKKVRHARDEITLAIALKEDHRHIGNVTLKRIDLITQSAEFAIVIGDKNTWGKGYSKEVGKLLCDHAFFELNLNRVYCGTFESNTAMCKLAAYLGMREEGRRRQAAFKDNRRLDLIEFGVLRDEYLARSGGGKDK